MRRALRYAAVVSLLIMLPSHVPGQERRRDNPFGATEQDFGGIRTFLRAPFVEHVSQLNADVAVLGVPFDQGTSYRPGARYGPREIREQSLIYAWARESGFFYIDGERTVLRGKRWADLGDIDVIPHDPKITAERITQGVKAVVAAGALPVVLGGDHSISFPVIRGLDHVPSLTVVHFDAHLDSYGTGDPDVMSHGGWVSQAVKLKNVGRIVQIGMRGLANGPGGLQNSKSYGAIVVTAEEVHRRGTAWALDQIPESASIYISIDIDVLDPAVAPGTGTVEVGGFSFSQFQDLLTALPSKGSIVGLDVVEVNPFYDATGVTGQVAARLIIDVLGAALK